MLSFEKLDAWKGCHALALAMLVAAKDSSVTEPVLLRRLCYTATRAAAKLAFGKGTRNRKIFRLAVARASGYLSEFGYHLSLARVMGILPEPVCLQLDGNRGRAAFYTRQLFVSLLGPPRRDNRTSD